MWVLVALRGQLPFSRALCKLSQFVLGCSVSDLFVIVVLVVKRGMAKDWKHNENRAGNIISPDTCLSCHWSLGYFLSKTEQRIRQCESSSPWRVWGGHRFCQTGPGFVVLVRSWSSSLIHSPLVTSHIGLSSHSSHRCEADASSIRFPPIREAPVSIETKMVG